MKLSPSRSAVTTVPLITLALLAIGPTGGAGADDASRQPPDATRQPDPRTAWFREAKFGMFIHWGVYAIPGRGEWVMYNEKIQVPEYEKFAARFNPVEFDAREWVSIAKAAGMRYITITSKHHDGFCMFDSKLTDYCIRNTPYKKDPLKALADECARQGIKLCFYHSIMDWHHPDYLPRRPWEKETRPAAGASFDRYLDHMMGQLRELLTNYGPIGVIWFDGGWEHKPEEQKAKQVVDLIHQLQPACLINDRTGLPEDFSTPEQTIPAGAMRGGRLWETCMTINDNWGYASGDKNFKSVPDLVRKLVDIASKGGNFLLNVGPTPEGKIQPEFAERLRTVGKWVERNGESVYGTTGSPWKPFPWGRVTRKGDRLYVHVFEWKDGGSVRIPVGSEPRSAQLLEGGRAVKASLAGDPDPGVVLALEGPAPDPVDWVIVLECAAPLQVLAAGSTPIRPEADGSFLLHARHAEVHGDKASYEEGGGKENIGFWVELKDWVSWDVVVENPGKFSVEALWATPDEEAGSRYAVEAAGAKLEGMVKGTGSYTKFAPEALGKIELPRGKHTIAVRPLSKPHGAVGNLKCLTLRPAP